MSARRPEPKMGRPPLPEGEAKGAIFCVRLSPEERAAVETAAAQSREKTSAWARRVLLEAARPGRT